MEKRNIDLSGHIIDSLILTKTMGIIMDKGGEFDILEIEVGRKSQTQVMQRFKFQLNPPNCWIPFSMNCLFSVHQ